MKHHPLSNIFPLMPEDDLEELAKDIGTNGLHEPVVLYEGMVLDGRNRLLACEMAGVEPKTRSFKGTPLDALAFVWSENARRRHLTPSQAAVAEGKRAILVAEYSEQVGKMKAEAGEKQKAGKSADGKAGGRGKKKNLPKQVTEGLEKPADRETSTRRARAAGTNRRYLEAAERLLVEDPERLVPVEAGEKTISQVLREEKREQVQAQLADLPGDKYRVLYADPPWSYGNSGAIGDSDAYSRVERHYPPLTIAQLCALDMASLAEDNAVLFLWVTSPLLAECWPVIKAWGFTYKASFVWDKQRHNFGHYNSVRHEFLLICTRGSCTPDSKELSDSVQSIQRSKEHSEKPAEFRAIIDKMYDKGRRIELFARTKVKGWDAWGAEAAK